MHTAYIPRPAVYRIKVATIGWMFSFATRKPLNTPHNADAASAANIATIIGAASELTDTSPPERIWQHTAAATAITAPTLMSCPPDAAVTSVIPTARITNSDARLITSTIYPYKTPLLIDTLKKPGVVITLTKSTAMRHTIGRNSLIDVSFFHPDF